MCVIITSARNKGNHPDDISAAVADRYLYELNIYIYIYMGICGIGGIGIWRGIPPLLRVDSCLGRICVVAAASAGVFITAENAKLRRPPDPNTI